MDEMEGTSRARGSLLLAAVIALQVQPARAQESPIVYLHGYPESDPSNGQHVFRSRDGGTTWDEIDARAAITNECNQSNGPISPIIRPHAAEPTVLFVTGGCYRRPNFRVSVDQGEHWSAARPGRLYLTSLVRGRPIGPSQWACCATYRLYLSDDSGKRQDSPG
jgi:hypothetical protein